MENYQCTGDCLKCQPAQRAYCASQHSYSNMKLLDRMMEEIISMKGEVRTLSEKIEAIQNNEAMIFNPNAQEGEGATE